MPQRNCHHVLTNGAICKAPPLRNRNYCRFHLDQIGRRMRAARARSQREVVRMDLPLFEDLHALQVGLMQLGEAIQHKEIEVDRGRLLLSVLRLAASNLKCTQSWTLPAHPNTGRETYVATSYDGFEQAYDLPDDLDLSADPLQLFPPPEDTETLPESVPQVPDSGPVPQVRDLPLGANLGANSGAAGGTPTLSDILRNAQTAIPGTHVEVTADDIEVWEIAEREGQVAADKRAAELERNRLRRERHLQRARYEQMARNRNIQIAAEILAARQQRAADEQRQAELQDQHAQDRVNAAEAVAAKKPPSPADTGQVPLAKDAAGGA